MRQFIAWVKQTLSLKKTELATKPTIINRSEHGISRKQLPQSALKVLYQLKDHGFEAYLVGGCVRDLLLGQHPKDFDVVTNAEPEEIKSLFRSALIIGRRFRLVHVRFHGEIIEVATFRKEHPNSEAPAQNEHGMVLRDNQYGCIEDDVIRRDFTINTLYYNIADFSVVDYVGGMADLKAGVLRLLGDPATRFREDPVRILRSLRFAAKLGFNIEEKTAKAIEPSLPLLSHVSTARLFDEMSKFFLSGHAFASYQQMEAQGLTPYLFPALDVLKTHPDFSTYLPFLETLFKQTDERIQAGKSVNPAFIYAGILWFPLLAQQKIFQQNEGYSPYQALQMAMQTLLNQQVKHIAIPKRLTTIQREIWQLQAPLEKRASAKLIPLLEHPRFRTAYDFLLLRVQAEPKLAKISAWWTTFYHADEEKRQSMIAMRRKRPQRKR